MCTSRAMQEQNQKQDQTATAPVCVCVSWHKLAVTQAGSLCDLTAIYSPEESVATYLGYLVAIPKRLEGFKAKEPLAVDCCTVLPRSSFVREAITGLLLEEG